MRTGLWAVVAACAAAVAAAAGTRGFAQESVTGRGVPAAPAEVNDRPIVGILTNPNQEGIDTGKRSYFPASYVKWVESGGARVAPVPFTLWQDDPQAFRDLVGSLNGFLFTGGGSAFLYPNNTLTPFALAAQQIFEHVVDSYDNGESVALWGTCQGFELINFLASGPAFPSVVTAPFDSENLSLPLIPASRWTDSRIVQAFQHAGADNWIETLVTTKPVTLNAHQAGVTPTDFANNANLTRLFGSPVSTNVDRNGKAFVSTIEGVGNLPIFATQWHPEKALFEWNPVEAIPHSADAVAANAVTARILGRWSRTNTRSFPSADAEQKALIYNYTPVYTFPLGDLNFEQCYFFD